MCLFAGFPKETCSKYEATSAQITWLKKFEHGERASLALSKDKMLIL